MSFVVGLTGGIASGKSAVGEQFSVLGIPVLDADQVARDVVSPSSVGLRQLIAHFGADILDKHGSLDRARMRATVFSNEIARRELEAILHPLIRRQMFVWRDNCTAPYCILMVPLLVKMGWQDLVDRLLVVDASIDDQLQRLIDRDGINTELAQKMIAAQDSREQRQLAADDLILNNGNLEDLQAMTGKCHQTYLAFAHGKTTEIEPMRLLAQ